MPKTEAGLSCMGVESTSCNVVTAWSTMVPFARFRISGGKSWRSIVPVTSCLSVSFPRLGSFWSQCNPFVWKTTNWKTRIQNPPTQAQCFFYLPNLGNLRSDRDVSINFKKLSNELTSTTCPWVGSRFRRILIRST